MSGQEAREATTIYPFPGAAAATTQTRPIFCLKAARTGSTFFYHRHRHSRYPATIGTHGRHVAGTLRRHRFATVPAFSAAAQEKPPCSRRRRSRNVRHKVFVTSRARPCRREQIAFPHAQWYARGGTTTRSGRRRRRRPRLCHGGQSALLVRRHLVATRLEVGTSIFHLGGTPGRDYGQSRAALFGRLRRLCGNDRSMGPTKDWRNTWA